MKEEIDAVCEVAFSARATSLRPGQWPAANEMLYGQSRHQRAVSVMSVAHEHRVASSEADIGTLLPRTHYIPSRLISDIPGDIYSLAVGSKKGGGRKQKVGKCQLL